MANVATTAIFLSCLDISCSVLILNCLSVVTIEDFVLFKICPLTMWFASFHSRKVGTWFHYVSLKTGQGFNLSTFLCNVFHTRAIGSSFGCGVNWIGYISEGIIINHMVPRANAKFTLKSLWNTGRNTVFRICVSYQFVCPCTSLCCLFKPN